MINILIVDDHPLVAGGVSTMLSDLDELNVIGSCKTGAETIKFLSQNYPDIILLDINLPDIDGLELCSDIKKQYSDIKVIGLTSTNEAAIIAGFLQRGGNGYLLKNMERHELLEAIQMVMDGKVYLSKASNDKLLENFHSLQNGGNAIPVLTRREKEIILLIADGLNGPQIAEKLFLSHYTVETHRKNLLKKFNVNNVQQMMKAAREFRLI